MGDSPDCNVLATVYVPVRRAGRLRWHGPHLNTPISLGHQVEADRASKELVRVPQRFWAAQPGTTEPNPIRKVIPHMPERSGRLEKRIRLVVPVEISTLQDLSATERTSTENVCSLGVRVVSERRKELNERLMIRSLPGDLRAVARVVYCQRLSDGRFGVGMQFLGINAKWRGDSITGARPIP